MFGIIRQKLHVFPILCEESKPAEDLVTTPWTKVIVPTNLRKYKSKDFFKADEFRLYFQCLSDKTSNSGSEKCSDGKESKIRLNKMVVVNVLHKNLEMFLLGKSTLLILLKISKALLAANETKKDWMRGGFFEE